MHALTKVKPLWLAKFGTCIGLAILMLGLAWGSLQASSSRADTQRWETHTREVLLAARDTLSALQDAETGQRGYLLTMRPNFLEPYETGVKQYAEAVERLAVLTQDNTGQQARIAELRRVAATKLANITETLSLAQNGNQAGALALVRTGRGKAIMDEARQILHAINAEENGLLVVRQAATHNAAAHGELMSSTLIAMGTIALLVAGTAAVSQRSAGRLQAAQEARRNLEIRLTQELQAHEALAEREAVLQRTEQQLRLALDAASLGVREIDLITNMATNSPESELILGWDSATLADTGQWVARVHPDDRAALLANWEQAVISPGTRWTNEYRFRLPDGSWRWINARSVVIGEAGRAVKVVGVVQDVTERKRIEEALQASEGRMQLAQEAAGLGIIDRDFVRGLYTWTDQQWRLLGLEPGLEPPTTAIWLSAVHPDDRPAVSAVREATWDDPAVPFDLEHRVVWPDGSVHWLKAHARALLGRDNRPMRAVCAMIDITESRENESALRRLSEGLEQQVQQEIAAREATQARLVQAEKLTALGQLAGGIAHDFNNILQAVSGGASLIGKHADEPAKVRRFGTMVEAAAQRGASITRRLLGFARRGELRAEAIPIPALLDGLHEVLTHTLGAAYAIRIDAGTGLPPVLADRGQLETVLVNLATNARDAMPLGGAITISATLETVRGTLHPAGLASGTYGRLTVKDTGTGMDRATLARVMEPFFTTKGPDKGTGLGLAMARGFAEQSGGALAIGSELGLGTTVTLWLPVTDATATTASEPEYRGPERPSKQPRVLLVDDEALVREILAEQLGDGGYDVVQADSGEAALALLDAGRAIDLIVTDLSMPGMNGVLLLHAAHVRRPRLPAILLTGYTSDAAGLAVGGAISGSFSLLRKPVSGAQLTDRVATLLEAVATI